MKREQNYVGRRMMEIWLAGKRKRGRPKRRLLDVVKEDKEEVGAREKDIENRTLWRSINPLLKGKERLKEEEKTTRSINLL